MAEPVEGSYVKTAVVVIYGSESEEATNGEENIQVKETREGDTNRDIIKGHAAQEWKNQDFI